MINHHLVVVRLNDFSSVVVVVVVEMRRMTKDFVVKDVEAVEYVEYTTMEDVYGHSLGQYLLFEMMMKVVLRILQI